MATWFGPMESLMKRVEGSDYYLTDKITLQGLGAMEIDKTTLNDISIFSAEEDLSVFNKLNLCNTLNGKEQLYYNFTTPLNSVDQIQGVQKTVQLLINKK